MENKTCSKPPARDVHLTHLLFAIKKKRRSSSGQPVFSMGFWPGAGIQQTQAIPGS